MKRFVVELLIERLQDKELMCHPADIANNITHLVAQYSNPLSYKVVGFTYRKEKADAQAK